MRVQLTVFFEGSFWVGVFERETGDGLEVGRVVFGAEPTPAQIHAWVLGHYPHRVPFQASLSDQPVPDVNHDINPKRAQREARQAMAHAGPSTKAQDAMRVAREALKVQARHKSREERDAERQRRFEMKQAQRREKHRGH